MQRVRMMSIATTTLGVVLLVLASLIAAQAASKERILYSLKSNTNLVGAVGAGLIFDSAGNLYGTSLNGGTRQNCLNVGGCGSVFELMPHAHGHWSLKVLHTFSSYNNPDKYGARPEGELTMDPAGNLYGVTLRGGDLKCSGAPGYGCGTVFQLTPGTNGKWTYNVLHRFTWNDGANPVAGLILDQAGNLYGTTAWGGSGQYGTVFEVIPGTNGQWTEQVLYNFQDGTQEGFGPETQLTPDAAGNLYGTTSEGNGNGSIFELTPNGKHQWSLKVLYALYKAPDYLAGSSGLILDGAGNLYGTTSAGGKTGKDCSLRCGVVFELMPGSNGQWTEKVLHYFQENNKDGFAPVGGVVMDSAGKLYGTTPQGGTGGGRCRIYCGVVFELTSGSTGWTEKILHEFQNNGKDGWNSSAGLVLDNKGNLYGTTPNGGNHSHGTVFEVTP